MGIMVVVAGLFSRMVLSTTGLRRVGRQNAVAAEAARVLLEEVRNQNFSDVFRLYNQDPTDDPGGVATGPGNRFIVDGLDPLTSAQDGLHMSLILPSLPPGTPSQLDGTEWEYVEGEAPGVPPGTNWTLREDYLDQRLGLPRDLNGDSVIDAEDHAGDYLLLPIIIRVEWQGLHGPRRYEVYTILADFIKT